MEQKKESNHDLAAVDVFTVVNHYFLLFFCLICILGSLFLQQLFASAAQFRIGIALAPLVGMILPVFLLTRKFPPGFRKQLRLAAPKVQTTSYVIVSTLLAVVVIDHIYLATHRLVPAPESFFEGLKELKPHGAWSWIITFIGLCIVVPLAEEIIFRGVVQQVFGRNMNGVPAFLLAGVFFGVMHLVPHLLVSVICFGIFLGYLFYATSNLIYPILAHAIFNGISFFELATTPENELSNPPFYVQSIGTLVVAAVLLAFFLRKINKGGLDSSKTPFDPSDV